MPIKKLPLTVETKPKEEDQPLTLKKLDRTKDAQELPELTEELVLDALRQVVDPEIPVDIVNLGLVYDVRVSGKNVSIKLTLTTPGCHMVKTIAKQAEAAVRSIGARQVMVDIVWDPPWNPDMMSDEAKERLGLI
ncbi:MAG: metal-sulfur cluster assembly factor [Candidatus Caldarchaeum sp.]